MSNPQYGKGDSYRPCNRKAWEEVYERIFRGKKEPSKKQEKTNGQQNNRSTSSPHTPRD